MHVTMKNPKETHLETTQKKVPGPGDNITHPVSDIDGVFPYAHCSLLQVVLEWVLGTSKTPCFFFRSSDI